MKAETGTMKEGKVKSICNSKGYYSLPPSGLSSTHLLTDLKEKVGH